MLEHRQRERRAHRARPDVVRQLVPGLEAPDVDGRPLRDRRPEDPIADEERPLGEVGRVAGELADAQVRAVVVLPEQHRRVEVKRLAQEPQREEHRLVNLLHARPREPLVIALVRGPLARGRRAEEAIAARIIAEPRDLGVELDARGLAHARDLPAEQRDVERREHDHEGEVRQRSHRPPLAEPEHPHRDLEPERHHHDDRARPRPREGADEPDADIHERKGAPIERSIDPQRRRERRDDEQRPELDIRERARLDRQRALAGANAEQQREGPRRHRGIRERQRARGVEDDEGTEGERSGERRDDPRSATHPENEEHERGHARVTRATRGERAWPSSRRHKGSLGSA